MTESQEIEPRTKIVIYLLSIIFMPAGFLVGIYLITHEDKKYNAIGKMIIELQGVILGVLVCIAILAVIVSEL
jgi:hypothetical protein